MAKTYPLKIENVGEETYMVMSRGHHEKHTFMEAVREAGYDWPLGAPLHLWYKATPNNETGGSTYNEVTKDARGCFPATLSVEAYGDEQYQPPASEGK